MPLALFYRLDLCIFIRFLGMRYIQLYINSPY